ncbi:MAG: phage portal protein, partial [Anaerolineae bacterium]|nr:phage portal protein [Anaerolineae bacterium]
MSKEVLDLVQKRLGDLVGDSWAERQEKQGEKVKLYREYYDGEHRGDMTPEMRAMLRLDGRTDDFNANFCEMVVDSLTDRLRVSSIDAVVPEPDDVVDGETMGQDQPEATEEPQKKAQKWVDDLLEKNRFDGLMLDVHDAVPKDADTFVMVEYDHKDKHAKMAFESAYDGDFGMIPVYDRMKKKIEAAVKIWWEMGYQYVNIYRPDHIERYQAVMADKEDGVAGTIQPVKEQELRLEQRPNPAGVEINEDGHLVWMYENEPLGVPVVPFSWNKPARKEHGTSELKKVIPLNDALNRNMYSMVMTAELTAFTILMSKGFDIPAGLTPGKSIQIKIESIIAALGGNVSDVSAVASLMASLDIKRLEPGLISPFIEQATFLIDLIAMISRTPVRTLMGGSTQSGESLKQREVGLIGKVKKAHVRLGNAWEDVVMLAHKLE